MFFRLIITVASCDSAFLGADSPVTGRLYRILLLLCIKLNYAMQRVVILNGPVAQPGRVPDFYQSKEIRLSRVRIPTGPHQFSFESARFIAGIGSMKFPSFFNIFITL